MTTYVVSVFEKPHWRTVLTTKDKAKALALAWAREIGDKVRVEEITLKPKEAVEREGIFNVSDKGRPREAFRVPVGRHPPAQL
ncbi:hypothetical protein [Mesorhizobium sp.]|uniref:hypothetical protein n=1 Tax=Mesorhizobium sp. TaxID=1871066 RepID=UPI0025FA285B|nr:hypothetical protein [Mesorhizobium sp.]